MTRAAVKPTILVDGAREIHSASDIRANEDAAPRQAQREQTIRNTVCNV
jgi:hypothetical protein